MPKLRTVHYVSLVSFTIAAIGFILLSTTHINNKGVHEWLTYVSVSAGGLFMVTAIAILLEWLIGVIYGLAVNNYREVVGALLKRLFILIGITLVIAGVVYGIINFPLQTIAVVLILILIAIIAK